MKHFYSNCCESLCLQLDQFSQVHWVRVRVRVHPCPAIGVFPDCFPGVLCLTFDQFYILLHLTAKSYRAMILCLVLPGFDPRLCLVVFFGYGLLGLMLSACVLTTATDDDDDCRICPNKLASCRILSRTLHKDFLHLGEPAAVLRDSITVLSA